MTDWIPGPGWLFCPADRPDRYLKALDRADVVILDLEDAVAPGRKEVGRQALRDLAQDGTLDRDRTVVRINAPSTSEHGSDLRVLDQAGVQRVMVAKAEDADAISGLSCAAIPLIETPLGVERVGILAQQSNVIGLMWGADDLVAGLGGTTSKHADGSYRDVARYARSRTLVAAKAFDRLALDAVHMDIGDLDGLRGQCADAAAVGFDGTVAIHPSQVDIIRKSYAPTSEQVDWATRLLEVAGPDFGVTTFEGRMVDGPVYLQARRIVQRAATIVSGSDG